MESNTQTEKLDEFSQSQEFKLEMENSICHYFEKCHLENNFEFNNKNEIHREETLIDNINSDIEYISSKSTPSLKSLKGISDFMINQVFSTDKIIPIDDSSDEESNTNHSNSNKETEDANTDNNQKKMSTCNSDITLNNEVQGSIENEEENQNISKSFATEFIDLFEMNMKELKSKKDDFNVIGLKNIKEEEEKEKNLKDKSETLEVRIKEEFLETKSKSKKSRHISLFGTLDRKFSTKSCHLHRFKSTSSKTSKHTLHDDKDDTISDIKSNKKPNFGFSKILKSVKKRMSQNFH